MNKFVRLALLYVVPPVLALMVVYLRAPLPVGIHSAVLVSQDDVRFASLDGPFAPNDLLLTTTHTEDGQLRNPDIVFKSRTGRLFVFDGRAQLFELTKPDPAKLDPFADPVPMIATKLRSFGYANGSPLGGSFLPDGNLVFCNTPNGLFQYNFESDEVQLLTDRDTETGARIHYCDDVVVNKNGTMAYFSDSLDYPLVGTVDVYLVSVLNALEGRPSGRVLSYEFATKETRVLVSNVFFANGVALSPDEDFLVVAETFRSRIMRIWLSGDKKGQYEPFGTSQMPGFVDSVTAAEGGGYWVAIPAVQPDDIIRLASYPGIRQLAMKLPSRMMLGPKLYGMIVKLDEHGIAEYSLQDPGCEAVCKITGVIELNHTLFIGHQKRSHVSVFQLPEHLYPGKRKESDLD